MRDKKQEHLANFVCPGSYNVSFFILESVDVARDVERINPGFGVHLNLPFFLFTSFEDETQNVTPGHGQRRERGGP